MSLLGEEQSGQIQEVGIGLYLELLERAVAALREGREPDLEAPFASGSEVDLQLPALLPEDYIPDVHIRLQLYKRMAGAADAPRLDDLEAEVIDRFGPLPPPAKTLLVVHRLRQRAAALGIRRFEPTRRCHGSRRIPRITASTPNASCASSSVPADATASMAPPACVFASRPPSPPLASPRLIRF